MCGKVGLIKKGTWHKKETRHKKAGTMNEIHEGRHKK
jgi:hypothetical protein